MSSDCLNCGCESLSFLSTKDYNRGVSDKIFQYLRCPSCGLIQLGNVPDNLDDYYPAQYYEIPKSREDLLRSTHLVKHKVDLILKYKPTGRLLEVGSAYGLFACLAKNAGYEVQVVEMDARCCRFIEGELGIAVIQSDDIVQSVRPLRAFDVIALWHVLEHVPEPWAIVEALAEKLTSGGIIVIATPNPESLQLKIFGARWTHIDAPRHLILIPRSVLRERLHKLGLEEILVTVRDRDSVGLNNFGWQYSLKNLARNRTAQKTLLMLGKVLTRLFHPLETAGGRGSCYTAIFRKPG